MPKVGMEQIRRRQVIDATLRCIIDEGLEKVTLDKAAEKAGVSKGVVAYYFKSKRNLLLESFKSFLQSYNTGVESVLSGREAPSTAKDLLKVIGAISIGAMTVPTVDDALSADDAGKLILQVYSRIGVDDAYKELTANMYKGYQAGIYETIQYGIDMGEWTLGNVEHTVMQIMAMLEGFIIFGINGFAGDRKAMYDIYSHFVDGL